MITVTLYFPDEIEQAIKDRGRQVGVRLDMPVTPAFRLTQFFAGVIAGCIGRGFGRPDLAQAFTDLNYRATDTPEG